MRVQGIKFILVVIAIYFFIEQKVCLGQQQLPCYSNVLLQYGFSYETWYQKLTFKQNLRKMWEDYKTIDDDIFALLAVNNQYGGNKHLFGSFHANFRFKDPFRERHNKCEFIDHEGKVIEDLKSYGYSPNHHWLVSPRHTESEMRHKILNFSLSRNGKFSFDYSYVYFPLALRVGIERQIILTNNANKQKILVFLLEEDDVFMEDFFDTKNFFSNLIADSGIQILMVIGHKNKTQEEIIDLMNGIVKPYNLFFVDFTSEDAAQSFSQKKSELLERLNTIIQCNKA